MHVKYIQFHEFGNPKEVLQVEYKNIEPLKNDELLVRMLVRPINPSDLIPITGAYAHRIPLPNIPGYEGIGIVEDVGAGVTRDLIGKRVLPLRGEGTWQETFRHLIRLVENKQLRFMKVHSTYDLADVKSAVDVVQSAEKTKEKVFLTSY
ncbi:alcohol dehydrogenase catalytic domain-containing protein [Bacillus wiedmannii]|uniref:alcohol dehydrogenase catalytic domain-containing protein n=1 Tax=Bacillus wiedmannii TaxID=1890302 RepID=UPI001144D5A0|nr:alcohol dehydrogenase catalytic domain-containing protein [Bacillus wiedmannii]